MQKCVCLSEIHFDIRIQSSCIKSILSENLIGECKRILRTMGIRLKFIILKAIQRFRERWNLFFFFLLDEIKRDL